VTCRAPVRPGIAFPLTTLLHEHLLPLQNVATVEQATEHSGSGPGFSSRQGDNLLYGEPLRVGNRNYRVPVQESVGLNLHGPACSEGVLPKSAQYQPLLCLCSDGRESAMGTCKGYLHRPHGRARSTPASSPCSKAHGLASSSIPLHFFRIRVKISRRCALCPVPCTLCPVPCALCTLPCALCTVRRALCAVSCVLYPVRCSLCLVRCALCPVPCVLYPVPCGLCLVSCALCPVSCALCPVRCKLKQALTNAHTRAQKGRRTIM
jgi:hypothetical protein